MSGSSSGASWSVSLYILAMTLISFVVLLLSETYRSDLCKPGMGEVVLASEDRLL